MIQQTLQIDAIDSLIPQNDSIDSFNRSLRMTPLIQQALQIDAIDSLILQIDAIDSLIPQNDSIDSTDPSD